MARIYKRSDRIPVRIDGIVVTLAPLTLDQKTEIQAAMIEGHVNRDLKEATRGIQLALKYSVKGISGVEDADGPYKLAIENDQLTDECVDDLLNLEITNKLAMVCGQMVKGVPSKFTDEKNEALEGVELVVTEKEPEIKNP